MANVLTRVRLLSVPLEPDNLNTFHFNSYEEQTNYFLNLYARFSEEECTYQRKDGVIRFPKDYEALRSVNYVMYKADAYLNPHDGSAGKWYYAFITKMEYVNEGLTNVYIETDPLQTWLFDYEVKPSFVEREHVDSDEVGEHTYPEQLETGDYICGSYNKADYAKSNDLMIVVGVTQDEEGNGVRGDIYNNIYSGVKYYCFANTTNGINELNTFLAKYPSNGAKDAITCMFLAPKKLGYRHGENTESGDIVYTNYVDTHYINHSDGETLNKTIAFTDNMFDGFIPNNAKTLCYPYRYLLASNNNGASATYKFEQFYSYSENDGVRTKTMLPPEFEIQGALSVGCSVRLIPTNYNGVAKNLLEGLTLGKFPALNWTSDVYTNWLTQNSVNIATSIGSSLIQTGLGVASMATGGIGLVAGAGAVAGGVQSVVSTIGEIYSHSLQPPQSEGNLNTGDVVTANGDNDFHFYTMQLKKEYAKIIDNFFDMYGYKVCRMKVPNINHREHYWHIKTRDVNIDGNVPADDMAKIKACYNKGITFWKDPNMIGNYPTSNPIVSRET